jgi:two-component system response regulator HydG
VAVNCAAVASGLFEAELFGHEKGAFTGADQARSGRVRAADGGTLFLDEVGELPLEMQAKLLRVLQEGEVDPVGGGGPVAVDCRVVAATNRDLRGAIADGSFREDLFYRLDVLRLHTPALAEHRADIPALAEHLLSRSAADLNLPRAVLDDDAAERLSTAPWPGNVRQLDNVLRRALVQCRQGRITADDLDIEDDETGQEAVVPAGDGAFPTLAQVEAEHVRQALARCEWNKSAAARLLGISRPTILRKIADYGLRPD